MEGGTDWRKALAGQRYEREGKRMEEKRERRK